MNKKNGGRILPDVHTVQYCEKCGMPGVGQMGHIGCRGSRDNFVIPASWLKGTELRVDSTDPTTYHGPY